MMMLFDKIKNFFKMKNRNPDNTIRLDKIKYLNDIYNVKCNQQIINYIFQHKNIFESIFTYEFRDYILNKGIKDLDDLEIEILCENNNIIITFPQVKAIYAFEILNADDLENLSLKLRNVNIDGNDIYNIYNINKNTGYRVDDSYIKNNNTDNNITHFDTLDSIKYSLKNLLFNNNIKSSDKNELLNIISPNIKNNIISYLLSKNNSPYFKLYVDKIANSILSNDNDNLHLYEILNDKLYNEKENTHECNKCNKNMDNIAHQSENIKYLTNLLKKNLINNSNINTDFNDLQKLKGILLDDVSIFKTNSCELYMWDDNFNSNMNGNLYRLYVNNFINKNKDFNNYKIRNLLNKISKINNFNDDNLCFEIFILATDKYNVKRFIENNNYNKLIIDNLYDKFKNNGKYMIENGDNGRYMIENGDNYNAINYNSINDVNVNVDELRNIIKEILENNDNKNNYIKFYNDKFQSLINMYNNNDNYRFKYFINKIDENNEKINNLISIKQKLYEYINNYDILKNLQMINNQIANYKVKKNDIENDIISLNNEYNANVNGISNGDIENFEYIENKDIKIGIGNEFNKLNSNIDIISNHNKNINEQNRLLIKKNNELMSKINKNIENIKMINDDINYLKNIKNNINIDSLYSNIDDINKKIVSNQNLIDKLFKELNNNINNNDNINDLNNNLNNIKNNIDTLTNNNKDLKSKYLDLYDKLNNNNIIDKIKNIDLLIKDVEELKKENNVDLSVKLSELDKKYENIINKNNSEIELNKKKIEEIYNNIDNKILDIINKNNDELKNNNIKIKDDLVKLEEKLNEYMKLYNDKYDNLKENNITIFDLDNKLKRLDNISNKIEKIDINNINDLINIGNEFKNQLIDFDYLNSEFEKYKDLKNKDKLLTIINKYNDVYNYLKKNELNIYDIYRLIDNYNFLKNKYGANNDIEKLDFSLNKEINETKNLFMQKLKELENKLNIVNDNDKKIYDDINNINSQLILINENKNNIIKNEQIINNLTNQNDLLNEKIKNIDKIIKEKNDGYVVYNTELLDKINDIKNNDIENMKKNMEKYDNILKNINIDNNEILQLINNKLKNINSHKFKTNIDDDDNIIINDDNKDDVINDLNNEKNKSLNVKKYNIDKINELENKNILNIKNQIELLNDDILKIKKSDIVTASDILKIKNEIVLLNNVIKNNDAVIDVNTNNGLKIDNIINNLYNKYLKDIENRILKIENTFDRLDIEDIIKKNEMLLSENEKLEYFIDELKVKDDLIVDKNLKLANEVNLKNDILNIYKNKIQKIDSELNDLIKNHEEIKNKYLNVNNSGNNVGDLDVIIKENELIKDQNKRLKKEIDNLFKQILNIKNNTIDYDYNKGDNDIVNEINYLDLELYKNNKKLKKLKDKNNKFNDMINDFNNKNVELDDKIGNIKDTITNLKSQGRGIINSDTDDFEKYLNDNNDLDDSKIDDLKNIIKSIKNNENELNDIINEKDKNEKEIDVLKNYIEQNKNEEKDLVNENKIIDSNKNNINKFNIGNNNDDVFLNKNKKFDNDNLEKHKINDELNNMYNQILHNKNEISSNDIKLLENEKKMYDNESLNCEEKLMQYHVKIKNLELEINNLKNIKTSYENEIHILQENIKKLKEMCKYDDIILNVKNNVLELSNEYKMNSGDKELMFRLDVAKLKLFILENPYEDISDNVVSILNDKIINNFDIKSYINLLQDYLPMRDGKFYFDENADVKAPIKDIYNSEIIDILNKNINDIKNNNELVNIISKVDSFLLDNYFEYKNVLDKFNSYINDDDFIELINMILYDNSSVKKLVDMYFNLKNKIIDEYLKLNLNKESNLNEFEKNINNLQLSKNCNCLIDLNILYNNVDDHVDFLSKFINDIKNTKSYNDVFNHLNKTYELLNTNTNVQDNINNSINKYVQINYDFNNFIQLLLHKLNSDLNYYIIKNENEMLKETNIKNEEKIQTLLSQNNINVDNNELLEKCLNQLNGNINVQNDKIIDNFEKMVNQIVKILNIYNKNDFYKDVEMYLNKMKFFNKIAKVKGKTNLPLNISNEHFNIIQNKSEDINKLYNDLNEMNKNQYLYDVIKNLDPNIKNERVNYLNKIINSLSFYDDMYENILVTKIYFCLRPQDNIIKFITTNKNIDLIKSIKFTNSKSKSFTYYSNDICTDSNCIFENFKSNLLKENNLVISAYGQTGSGKTFTLFKNPNGSLIKNTVNLLGLDKNVEYIKPIIIQSYLNNSYLINKKSNIFKIFTLENNTNILINNPLKNYKNVYSKIFTNDDTDNDLIEDEFIFKSNDVEYNEEKYNLIIKNIENKRVVRNMNELNKESSRSHLMIILKVKYIDKKDPKIILFLDLCGNEKVHQKGKENAYVAKNEGISINNFLSWISNIYINYNIIKVWNSVDLLTKLDRKIPYFGTMEKVDSIFSNIIIYTLSKKGNNIYTLLICLFCMYQGYLNVDKDEVKKLKYDTTENTLYISKKVENNVYNI